MIEIKAALDAAFAAYFDALANGVPEQTALDVGIARCRAFFPNAAISPFEAVIEAAREKAQSASAARVIRRTAIKMARRCGRQN